MAEEIDNAFENDQCRPVADSGSDHSAEKRWCSKIHTRFSSLYAEAEHKPPYTQYEHKLPYTQYEHKPPYTQYEHKPPLTQYEYKPPLTQWIGRGAVMAGPPRSPDITPLDFYLWDYVKQHVYSERINGSNHLKQRITDVIHSATPDGLTRVWEELDYRLDVCWATSGSHIELR
ncbi:hypothetical protein AVEN_181759-1 [Araneus ventricosus]|uniref:Uncharacterized protein n=1 Tax=Araneus ventricosus TaxID=182803 RepID=A0A4Y2P171_ARAVE|nr:hypothetical protein AVEN_181759-1 [Araneus ventricosus]